jgi:transposase
MEKFIGIDIHKATCTFGVVGPTGKRARQFVVETNGQKIVEQICSLDGKKYVCFEEGPASQWLVEILSPHVEQILITTRSRKRESSNDSSDAIELANAIRVGSISERVVKPTPQLVKLRSLCDTYRKLTGDSTRTKNRIHTLYRSRGISSPTGDSSLWMLKRREEMLERLPERLRDSGELLFEELDDVSYLRRQALKLISQEVKEHAIVSILRTAPGFGLLRSALLLATAITPHRFRTKRQFWSYAGLSVITRSSNDWMPASKRMVRHRSPLVFGLTKRGNRTLKSIFIGAALTACSRCPEVRAHHEKMTSRGLKPEIARIAIARKIAAIVLAMWKLKEAYDPKKYVRFER